MKTPPLLPFLAAFAVAFSLSPLQLSAGDVKPFHFAHRGGAHEFEENTMFAFRSCYDRGIRGFELDVRMTGDGALVVLHDDSLDRTHKATGPVEHLNAEAARAIRSKVQNEPLLFLDTLLAYLNERPGLYVEFEMKTSNDDLYPDERIEPYVTKLHRMVTESAPAESTYVFTSFDVRPLRAIRKVDPEADIMLIKGGPLTPEVMEAARSVGARRIGARMEGTTRLAVQEAQKQGFIVTGWPGHSLNDYFLGLGLGVNAICTDYPVMVQEYIDSVGNGNK